MQSITFVVAFAALLALCVCAPTKKDVIQKIPENAEGTPLVIGGGNAGSGAAGKESGSGEKRNVHEVRVRREVAGHESDLLPSGGEVDASPFGETSQLAGHGRIRVLPAYLG